ncbi:hypothetical protein TNCV_1213461 [Trichonephila clavipes]|nr:hypothetical protein TNCV_1213461 [Trichonephila clavipes]
MLRENPQTQQVAFSSSFIACRSEKGSHSLTLLHRNYFFLLRLIFASYKMNSANNDKEGECSNSGDKRDDIKPKDSLQEPEETAWNSRRNLEILERIVTEIIRRHWSTVKRNRRRYG